MDVCKLRRGELWERRQERLVQARLTILLYMVVSRCRGIGPPSSGIILGTLFLLATDLRRHIY